MIRKGASFIDSLEEADIDTLFERLAELISKQSKHRKENKEEHRVDFVKHRTVFHLRHQKR